MDAEGVTHRYLFDARSRRRAKRDAHEWLTRAEWAESLVEITPMVDNRGGVTGSRLLAVAGVTFAVSGVTITALVILGLSLEGAL